MTYKVTEEGNISTIFLDGEIDMDKTEAAKELIYLPLSYAEQTQGKALIDIMVYRQAKLLASVILIVLSAREISVQAAGWYTVAAISIWGFISFKLWSKLRRDTQSMARNL